MAINLKKNEKALHDAYDDVLNPQTDTNWAVFTYDGNTNTLKVYETGDGDMDEMIDELSSGKMMYVFMRVKDPNTELYKNVLVNWSGEGVPSSRKGVCAQHLSDVARFFRSVHVTINARSEVDLEEDTILNKVAKASGANFSVHKEKARPMAEAGPVGSVYKKSDIKKDINESRDEFWSKEEKIETDRVMLEKNESAQVRRKEELERRERERNDGIERDKKDKIRFQSIDKQKKQQQIAMKKEQDEKEEEMQARLSRREKEINADIDREKLEKKQRVQQHSPMVDGVKNKKSAFERPAQEPTRPPARPPPKSKRTVPLPHRPVPEPEPEPVPEPEPEPEPVPEPEPEPEPEPDHVYKMEEFEQKEPEQSLYDDVQTEEHYPDEPEQPLYDDLQEAEPEQTTYDDVQDRAEPEAPLYDDVPDKKEPEQAMYDDLEGIMDTTSTDPIYDAAAEPQEEEESELRAQTLYDYEAEDEGELTFDVDEIITDVEQLDPGWWRGTRQLDGSNGLFPANYVQLI